MSDIDGLGGIIVIDVDGVVVIVIEGMGRVDVIDGTDDDMLCVIEGTVMVMLGIAVDIEPDVSAPASTKS